MIFALTDFLYSFAATRTIFKPYQFLPALKILSGSTGRILIADEVGLGKTIEAGLIWTELEQRSPIRRGLIVVPSRDADLVIGTSAGGRVALQLASGAA